MRTCLGPARQARSQSWHSILPIPSGASWVPLCRAHQPCRDTEAGSARMQLGSMGLNSSGSLWKQLNEEKRVNAGLYIKESLKLWSPVAHKSDSEQTQARVFAFNISQSPGVCSPTFSHLGSTREAFPSHRPKQLPSTQGRGAAKAVWRMSHCLSGKWGQREEMWFPVLVPAQLRKGQSSAGAVLLLQSLCPHHVLKGESSVDGCGRLSSSRGSQFS